MIRSEQHKDYKQVERVVRRAFEASGQPYHHEHALVGRLRSSVAFVPALSLVAEKDGQVVGHVLFTRIQIGNDSTAVESLALAPVSVLPEYQNQGIGSRLIETGLERARELGFASVVMPGHSTYYPRFGFEPAERYGVRAPFKVAPENFMIVSLRAGALANVQGMVRYAPEFSESCD